jgi:hypothetical protein
MALFEIYLTLLSSCVKLGSTPRVEEEGNR